MARKRTTINRLPAVIRSYDDATLQRLYEMVEREKDIRSRNRIDHAISAAISQWSIRSGNLMTASEIQRATDRAVAAIVAGAPNAHVATTPESAFWQTATGPSRS